MRKELDAMGFDQKHYVPILKAKAGELRALKEATDSVRATFTPVLEVMDVPPRYIEGADEPIPSKSVEAHVVDVSKSIAKACGTGRNVFIDGFYIEELAALGDGREPIGGVLDELREADVKAIPVTGLDRFKEYNEAVKQAVEQDERGVCLRLQEPDLASDTLDKQISAVLNGLDLSRSTVDLGAGLRPRDPPKSSLVPMLNAIPRVKEWRSFTLAASSFPVNMAGVAKYATVELDREEWTNWTFLRSRSDKLLRVPTFGDYAINHPTPSDIDPREMRMSANIRYTWTTTFLIAKGEATPRKRDAEKKAAPAEQYPLLAQTIIDHKAWCGPKFSWGDSFIQKCANRECVGGPREWRAVGTSHHFAFVAKQLTNLP
jgi:hypothetical protein